MELRPHLAAGYLRAAVRDPDARITMEEAARVDPVNLTAFLTARFGGADRGGRGTVSRQQLVDAFTELRCDLTREEQSVLRSAFRVREAVS